MSAEDQIISKIYDAFREAGSLENFIRDICKFGIKSDDPRLLKLSQALGSKDSYRKDLDLETFSKSITPFKNFLKKYSNRHFVIPYFESFKINLSDIYDKCKLNTDGNNASYIPQLSTVPDYWGVSVCTVDGQRFSIGDTKVPFTIQSCSKPLSYAIALECFSSDIVHRHVGQEPSGRMFNEMILDHNNKPHNPMINAGAIVTASLLHTLLDGHLSTAQKFHMVKSWIEKAAGEERLGFDNTVFLSEREVADRNFALGYFMREKKVFPPRTNMLESLDFYFQLCSIEATADALATAAATLANGGVCPTTEAKVFSPETVRDVLSLMHSCGLYDYSGQFAFKVGLPAKSGVAGAIMLVIPNTLGICCFSPKLDQHGNSVRGIQFCEDILKVYAVHPYDNFRHTSRREMDK